MCKVSLTASERLLVQQLSDVTAVHVRAVWGTGLNVLPSDRHEL